MDKDSLRTLGLLTQVGLTVVAAIGLGVYGGYWADQWLATSPWLTLAGIVLGAAAGFRAAYQLLIQENDRKKMDDGKS